MSFKISYSENKATVTFNDRAEENEFTNAFLEVVDTVNIKKLDFIIFNCINVIHYSIPVDYMTRVKVLTLFSTSWNPDVDILFITTHSEIKKMVDGFINHDDDLKWEYHLFEDMKCALNTFPEI